MKALARCESPHLAVPAAFGTQVLTRTMASRFVAVPVPEMKEKLNSQIKQVETDVDGLDKRLHYLETTAKNSQVSHACSRSSHEILNMETDNVSGSY